MIFLTLPDAILTRICGEYLLLEDLARLDTALVRNDSNRQKYLDMLSSPQFGVAMDPQFKLRSMTSIINKPYSAGAGSTRYFRLSDSFAWLYKRGVKVSSMSLWNHVNDLLLVRVSNYFRDLKYLTICLQQEQDDWLTDAFFVLLGFNMRQLTSLRLICCKHITDISIIEISNYLCLRELSLYLCDQISDRAILALARTQRDIEVLDISCPLITDVSFVPLIQANKKIRSCNLRSCAIGDAGVTAISAHLSQLTTLNLMECSSITDKSVKLLKNPIETLCLSNCYNLTDEAIIAVSENLPDLKDLGLFNCPLVTNTSIIRVAANLRGLKSLDIRYTRASDLAVEAIVTNLSLKELFLCHCDITDKSIHQIATSQLELEKFYINECIKITDESVIELAKLDRLTQISCDETNITDQSLYAFAAKTTPLIELGIRNCPHVTLQGRDAVRSRVIKYFVDGNDDDDVEGDEFDNDEDDEDGDDNEVIGDDNDDEDEGGDFEGDDEI